MPSEIGREAVRTLLEAGAQLIEVLPAEEYEAEHLPTAISIPLRELDRSTTARLGRNRPMVVYCADGQ
jgi:rhodanese-related sulfurtransferase